MELVLYIVICGISSAMALTSKKKISFLPYIIFIIILSTTIRFNVQGDIQDGYVPAMKYTSFNFYYVKEAIFWFGLRFLYILLNSSFLVLITVDLMVGILIYYSFLRINIPAYAYLSFFSFFPTILFMQNVFRQWVAVVFLIFAIGFLKSSSKKFIAYIISIFTHNAAFLALPLIGVQQNKKYSIVFTEKASKILVELEKSWTIKKAIF